MIELVALAAIFWLLFILYRPLLKPGPDPVYDINARVPFQIDVPHVIAILALLFFLLFIVSKFQ